MKIRVKFSKAGVMKFIGHLDVMRYFQKAIRRAEIRICYSEGFSPHQIMSFAAPLGLGDTSECEYMDIEVSESGTSEEMVERLNAVMVPDIHVLSWRLLPDTALNAMAATAAADYEVTFRENFRPEDLKGFCDGFNEYLAQKEIFVLKKTKKSEKVVDVRPLLLDYSVSEKRMFFRVLAGSTQNLKPELLFEGYYQTLGKELSPAALQIHRKELYTDLGSGQNKPDSPETPETKERQLVSLEALGTRICEPVFAAPKDSEKEKNA